MNKYTAHDTRGQKTRPPPASHAAASVSASVTTKTIYKVAELSRVLKSATRVVEEMVHFASDTNNHLTLLHWLVLVSLSRAPTCKQMELKSDTKIAAAYLTRLVDDLTRESLVRRHRSSQDRRQILLALTERGRNAAFELLASLNDVTQPSQLNAIEHLGASLEQFVSLAARERWGKNRT